jgi:hypothetical protein
MVKQKAESSPLSLKDLVDSLGIWGFLSLMTRMTLDVLSHSDLRASMWKAVPVRRIMHGKDTREYFGYVLITGKK